MSLFTTRTIPSEPPAPLLSTAPRVVISLWLHRSPSSPYFSPGERGMMLGLLAHLLAGWLAARPICEGATAPRKGTDERNDNDHDDHHDDDDDDDDTPDARLYVCSTSRRRLRGGSRRRAWKGVVGSGN